MSAAPTPPPEGVDLLRSSCVLEKATIAWRLSESNTIEAVWPKVTPSLLTNAPPGGSSTYQPTACIPPIDCTARWTDIPIPDCRIRLTERRQSCGKSRGRPGSDGKLNRRAVRGLIGRR